MGTLFTISLYLTYLIYGSIAELLITEPMYGSCNCDGCCNGPGEGDCYCDQTCFSFGDCCHDIREVCSLDSTSNGHQQVVSLRMACPRVMSTIPCSFEFTNNGQEDVYLLKRDTPLEGFTSPFITVHSPQGDPLQYKGLYVYHAPLTKDDFVLLKAGQTIPATVDITRAFSIDSNGLYTIQYSKPVKYLTVEGAKKGDYQNMLQSVFIGQPGSVYLENAHLLSRPQVLAGEEEEEREIVTIKSTCRISFANGGTSSQRRDIVSVHGYLCSFVGKVANAVTNDTHYELWFGTYDTTRAQKVIDNFEKISDGFKSSTLTYDFNGADCKSDWVAYTTHGSRRMYMCPYFHKMKVGCVNSDDIPDTKEGVVLHEWTHAYGNTVDDSYGTVEDQNLARDYPDKAVNNADNYERYYCPASFRAAS